MRTALNEKELGYSTAWQGTHPWLRLSAPRTVAGLPGRLRLCEEERAGIGLLVNREKGSKKGHLHHQGMPEG